VQTWCNTDKLTYFVIKNNHKLLQESMLRINPKQSAYSRHKNKNGIFVQLLWHKLP
jgi:hypothetical protein